jgi:hypothetical protein
MGGTGIETRRTDPGRQASLSNAAGDPTGGTEPLEVCYAAAAA